MGHRRAFQPRMAAGRGAAGMAAALVALLATLLLLLHGPARADEAAVRQASDALVQAWNRHDVKAWGALLPEDVWYTESWDTYERFKGRDQAIGLSSFSIENSDLQWDIVRMKTRPDGVVSVVLVQRMSMLPRTDGKYKSVFTSDPSLARWRRDADGRWRLFFFTSDKGWATAEIRKDDEAGSGTAAPPAASATPASTPRASPPRGATGSEPAEYTAFWGWRAQGCNFCHGRPPGLPSSSEAASRIVAAGAATAGGAELRAAMQRKELGGSMDHIIADPALTDAALDAVRRYLVDVRDGVLPDALVFDAAGATREVELRNERSTRDAPVRIARLRVAGPFALVGGRSTCHQGATLAGQAACRVVLRAAPGTALAAGGALEVQFAPTPGLEPKPRRTVLRVGD